MKACMWLKQLRKPLPVLIVVLATITVACLAYSLQYAPVIYSDDWDHVISQYAVGTLRWFDWSNRRPLLDIPLILLYAICGVNVTAFHITLIGLHLSASLQLYWLLRRINVGGLAFALGVSLLFLVFPADYTHMWLTQIGIWVAINLLFVYAHLLLTYCRGGSVWLLVASCILLVASLGIYEAQLGLAFAWPVLLLWIKFDIPRDRRIMTLLALCGVGLVFAAWRFLGVPAIGAWDPQLGSFQIDPWLVVDRLWLGLKILAWSWAVPLQRAMRIESNWHAWGVISASMVLCWSVAAMVRHRSIIERPRADGDATKQSVRMIVASGVGLVFVIVGYLPMVGLREPNLYSTGSRANLFAIIGASLTVVSLIYAGSVFFTRNRITVDALAIAGLLPLLVLGTVTQAWIQRDSRVAWDEQKDVWQQLFSICPNLLDDTSVYFILPGYEDRWGWANWRRTPFDASWEITAALRVLYERQSLHGDVLFPDLDRGFGTPTLTQQGVADYWSAEVTPFERAVFVSYQGSPRKLRMVENLQSELQLPWEPQDYTPGARCLPGPAPDVELRRLVASGD